MDEEKVACFMATFGISEEEAKQMIADDEAIDHGADLFPLTAEQKKASKQGEQEREPTPSPNESAKQIMTSVF